MYELPKSIDPGEAVLAVVGVRPLLIDKVEAISHSQWDEVGRLDRTVRALARDLAQDKLDRKSFPAVDYDRALTALSEGPSPTQISDIVAQFPIELHEVTTSYMGQCARALNYLKQKFPISVVRSVFGAVNVRPSDYALGRFEDVLEIVDRPLSVFAMVDVGRLTSDMALALMTVYPSLYAFIVGAIVTRVVHEKAAHGNNYDPHFERGMAVLLAVPGVSAELRQQLQTPSAQQAPSPSPPSKAKSSPGLQAPASEQQQFDSFK